MCGGLAYPAVGGRYALRVLTAACSRAGVGCAMVTVSLVVCIYYNVIMSYTVYYMVASFASEVPWAKCDPAWADMATCYVRNTEVCLVCLRPSPQTGESR